jgi:hypothetical protein
MRITVVLAILCATTAAHAQLMEPGADVDKPAALQLFEEGRTLLSAGRTDEACKKFELSIRKDPRAVGTLLNLGLCNERLGKLATALSLFVEAFDRAHDASQPEQQAAAEEHIKALRPQVPVVAISYVATPLAGERLLIDERVVGRDETELPLDPGPHTIVFTAPGRLPYEVTVVTKASTRTPMRLPDLAVPPRGSNPRRTAGKVSTIGGVALLAGAGVLALVANRKYDQQFEGSSPHCGASPPIDGREVCDAIGAAAVADSRSLATTASIVAGIGAATTIIGLTLWITAPSDQPRLVPTAGSSGAGLALVGRF